MSDVRIAGLFDALSSVNLSNVAAFCSAAAFTMSGSAKTPAVIVTFAAGKGAAESVVQFAGCVLDSFLYEEPNTRCCVEIY